MGTALAHYWWVLALRGVLGILFGILAFVWPLLTLEVLVLLFGAYSLVDGIFTVVAAFRAHQRESRWWALLLQGIVGIIAGLLIMILPGVAAFALVYFVAAWALITGVLQIAAAIRLREQIENEWMLILGGAASVIFGVLTAVWPAAGLLSLVWLIGAYAIIFGILMLALAFRLRGRAEGTQSPAAA
jgi:uncharacterized membrane protein HdeD (DUF308 family)